MNPPTAGLSTKEVLLQVLAKVEGIEKRTDETRESQIRTETILSEGRFGQRIADLEAFKNNAQGALGLAKWAVGGSGLALVLGIIALVKAFAAPAAP